MSLSLSLYIYICILSGTRKRPRHFVTFFVLFFKLYPRLYKTQLFVVVVCVKFVDVCLTRNMYFIVFSNEENLFVVFLCFNIFSKYGRILCRIGIVKKPFEKGIVKILCRTGIVKKSFESGILKNPLSDWNSKEVL